MFYQLFIDRGGELRWVAMRSLLLVGIFCGVVFDVLQSLNLRNFMIPPDVVDWKLRFLNSATYLNVITFIGFWGFLALLSTFPTIGQKIDSKFEQVTIPKDPLFWWRALLTGVLGAAGSFLMMYAYQEYDVSLVKMTFALGLGFIAVDESRKGELDLRNVLLPLIVICLGLSMLAAESGMSAGLKGVDAVFLLIVFGRGIFMVKDEHYRQTGSRISPDATIFTLWRFLGAMIGAQVGVVAFAITFNLTSEYLVMLTSIKWPAVFLMTVSVLAMLIGQAAINNTRADLPALYINILTMMSLVLIILVSFLVDRAFGDYLGGFPTNPAFVVLRLGGSVVLVIGLLLLPPKNIENAPVD